MWYKDTDLFLLQHQQRKLSVIKQTYDIVAEWLRRLTRNQMESFRMGSNPINVDKRSFLFACFFFFLFSLFKKGFLFSYFILFIIDDKQPQLPVLFVAYR